ncbi:MAG: type I phosphomannose isomerase catalytic subunit [Ruminococcus sp.]|nr:type I phosphomannose isomerase catalytic subunit [Ruminococcus sp.]
MYRINRNSLSDKINKPFLLKPVGKDYLWGGDRLNYDFGKNIPISPLSETWECSTHPDGPSTVVSGVFSGLSLPEVLKLHPEFMGTHPENKTELPILIKFIDAKKDLSVQVHPDDEYAKDHENGQLGKTEMWYVLDALPDAKLVYGLHHKADRDKIRTAIENGKLENYLQKVSIKKDDVFYIEAGTIHAIGAGALIAEIQENSNLTYRLYDYERVDKNGKKRPLHVDKALEVANLYSSASPRQPMRVLKYQPGWASELLCRCKYFQVERIMLNTETNQNMVTMQVGSTSFNVLLCVGGCGVIFYGDEARPFFKGDCIFVPADSVEMHIHGKASLLKVSC